MRKSIVYKSKRPISYYGMNRQKKVDNLMNEIMKGHSKNAEHLWRFAEYFMETPQGERITHIALKRYPDYILSTEGQRKLSSVIMPELKNAYTKKFGSKNWNATVAKELRDGVEEYMNP